MSVHTNAVVVSLLKRQSFVHMTITIWNSQDLRKGSTSYKMLKFVIFFELSPHWKCKSRRLYYWFLGILSLLLKKIQCLRLQVNFLLEVLEASRLQDTLSWIIKLNTLYLINRVRYKLLICSSLLLACGCFSWTSKSWIEWYLHAFAHAELLYC